MRARTVVFIKTKLHIHYTKTNEKINLDKQVISTTSIKIIHPLDISTVPTKAENMFLVHQIRINNN